MKAHNLTSHLAALAAYSIFGFNIIVCKDLTASGIFSPILLFFFRSLGAGFLFWFLSAFVKEEKKVAKRDYPKIFLAALFGYFLTQITFLVAIPDVTPMTCSILSALSPVFTMLIAAVVIHEPISAKKAGGVVLSFVGIVFLILNSSQKSGAAENTPLGIIMMLLNPFCFAVYLGAFKPLIQKYPVVTFMKWIFLFSFLMSAPLALKDLISTDYASVPVKMWLDLAYLIVFSTFIAYFLIPYAQKTLRPTLVSMYSYIQPIIATSIGIILGMDSISLNKILALAAIFTGVLLVSFSRSKHS